MLRRQAVLHVRVVCMSLTPKGSAVGAALTKLGYRCYDLQTVFSSKHARTDAAKWTLIYQGREHVELSLFKDHDAVCGLPASGAAERLLAELPAYTKVILAVESDKAQWAEHYKTEVPRLLASSERMSRRGRLSASWNSMLQRMYPMTDRRGRPYDDPIAALEAFEDLVKRSVPPQRLLVYHVGDGWTPLMHFLEIAGKQPEPDEPFPQPDTGSSVLRGIGNRMTNAYWYATGLVYGSLFVAVVYIFPGAYNAVTNGNVESAFAKTKAALSRGLGDHVAPVIEVLPGTAKVEGKAAMRHFGLGSDGVTKLQEGETPSSTESSPTTTTTSAAAATPTKVERRRLD